MKVRIRQTVDIECNDHKYEAGTDVEVTGKPLELGKDKFYLVYLYNGAHFYSCDFIPVESVALYGSDADKVLNENGLVLKPVKAKEEVCQDVLH